MDALYGIYNADDGIMGELAYVWGKIRGTAHCALCDESNSGLYFPSPDHDSTPNKRYDLDILESRKANHLLQCR